MSAPRRFWSTTRCGIAACIVDGLTEAESAGALGFCKRYVERQEAVLRRELGARNRVHLAALLGARTAPRRPDKT